MIKINLEIDDEVREFNLPQNWDEVTIGDFVKIFSINKENLTQFEVAIKTINILTGIDEETIMMMNVNDFESMTENLMFTKTDITPINVDSIELNGEVFYLKNDFSQLTMGEVISIETILQSADGNLFKVMDKLLCIFLRKKKDNGKLENFKGTFMSRADLFKTAPITKVYNIFSFFSNGGTTLEDSTKVSLESLPQ